MHQCSQKFLGHRFARRWHGRHGGMGSRHGGHGRLGRFFAHGDLRFLILKLISEKPRHGYEIIKAIEEGVAGAYTPSPGVIYPTLTLLDELGWVQITASEGTKKLYEVTDDGKLALEANRATVDIIIGRMAEIRSTQAATAQHQDDDVYAGTDADVAPPIRHAMRSLMSALRHRHAGTDLTQSQAMAIAAILTAAAEKIEQAT